MRRILFALCFGFLVGCGTPPTDPADAGAVVPEGSSTAEANKLIGLLDRVVAELEKVTDEASAQAAAVKLEPLGEQIDAIQKAKKTGSAHETLGDPDGIIKRQTAAMAAYDEQVERISALPGASKPLEKFLGVVTP